MLRLSPRRFGRLLPRQRDALLHMVMDASSKPYSWRPDRDEFDGVTVDEHGAVTVLDMEMKDIKGSVDFSVLTEADFPALARLVSTGTGRFSGTLNFSKLPRALRVIDIGWESGTIKGIIDAATARPPDLESLNIQGCCFEEPLIWNTSPASASSRRSGAVTSTSPAPWRSRSSRASARLSL
jgi:hypothetical protein